MGSLSKRHPNDLRSTQENVSVFVMGYTEDGTLMWRRELAPPAMLAVYDNSIMVDAAVNDRYCPQCTFHPVMHRAAVGWCSDCSMGAW